ncbi:transcriptional regulator, HxlR family protein [Flammeovirgaceae bacterium 311]|nr:transcriptional regulator, HxlR family protein [Flammeovirgaceae bacterium 311]
MPIIGTLLFGKKLFMEMERSIFKITPRMLSKELKELELNGIVKRTVSNTTPVIVAYGLTDSGITMGVFSTTNRGAQWGMGSGKSPGHYCRFVYHFRSTAGYAGI